MYFQVNEWKGNPLDLNPTQWGCKEDGLLLPIPTDQLPAPDYLTEVIRCNCKTGCNTLRCNCRKHGMDCSPICGDCKGISCVPIPLHLRLKVVKTRGPSVGITKKVWVTESEMYHDVLHIHDRDQMYHCDDIGITYEVYDYAYLFPWPWEHRYRCLINLNQINTSKVIVKNVFCRMAEAHLHILHYWIAQWPYG